MSATRKTNQNKIPTTTSTSITTNITKNNDSKLKVAGGNGSGTFSINTHSCHQRQQTSFKAQKQISLLRPEQNLAYTTMITKKSQSFHYQREMLLTIAIAITTTHTTSSAHNNATITRPTNKILSNLPHLLSFILLLMVASRSCFPGGQCAPTRTDASHQQQEALNIMKQSEKYTLHSAADLSSTPKAIAKTQVVLVELAANHPSNQEPETATSDDETLLVVLADQPVALSLTSTSSSSQSIRRLIKRSGISDQRLAEIQMIRALKKQLERASKITSSNLNSAGQESTSS